MIEIKNWKHTPIEELEVPDEWRIVPAFTEATAKIYRSTGMLLNFDKQFKFTTLRADGTIPIRANGRVIGCVTNLYVQGESAYAEFAIDYATPERLELETGASLYLVPDLTITSGGIKEVRSANLTLVHITKKPVYETSAIGSL